MSAVALAVATVTATRRSFSSVSKVSAKIFFHYLIRIEIMIGPRRKRAFYCNQFIELLMKIRNIILGNSSNQKFITTFKPINSTRTIIFGEIECNIDERI